MKTQRPELDALTVFALATFHASFFLLAFVLFLYWTDVLRQVLPNLNTVVGLAIFVGLWAITWWTTRRAVRGMKGAAPTLGSAATNGGLTGMLFLQILALTFGIGTALRLPTGHEPFHVLSTLLGATLVLGLFGTPFAFALGSIVGFVLGAIDLGLLALTRRLIGE